MYKEMVSRPPSETCLDSETLFRRYAEFVASFLYRLGAPLCDVEDLVQDVFVTAHNRGGYKPGSASPKTFLARISFEARLAHERRNKRWRTTRLQELAAAVVGNAPEDPERALDCARAADKLESALDAIEPGMRAVFVLFELEGESCAAIADGLGLKLGTVYSRLHTARSKFLAAVRSHELPNPSSLGMCGKQEAI